MNDLISRQTAINKLLEKGQTSRRYKLGQIWELNFDEIREAMASVPSVKLIKPEKGKWIQHHEPYTWMEFTYWTCSECNYGEDNENRIRTNFCPNCGADMRGEKEPTG